MSTSSERQQLEERLQQVQRLRIELEEAISRRYAGVGPIISISTVLELIELLGGAERSYLELRQHLKHQEFIVTYSTTGERLKALLEQPTRGDPSDDPVR